MDDQNGSSGKAEGTGIDKKIDNEKVIEGDVDNNSNDVRGNSDEMRNNHTNSDDDPQGYDDGDDGDDERAPLISPPLQRRMAATTEARYNPLSLDGVEDDVFAHAGLMKKIGFTQVDGMRFNIVDEAFRICFVTTLESAGLCEGTI